jgi:hypothetical protein
MLTREDLQEWLVDALHALGGAASPKEVCRYIWTHHEDDLRSGGDLLYTWQYDIRWANQILRDKGITKTSNPTGIWRLIRDPKDDA